jgi:hypothetical protein
MLTFYRRHYTRENMKLVVFDNGHTLLGEVFCNVFEVPVFHLEVGKTCVGARKATINAFESSKSCVLSVNSSSASYPGAGENLRTLSCKQIVYLGILSDGRLFKGTDEEAARMWHNVLTQCG